VQFKKISMPTAPWRINESSFRGWMFQVAKFSKASMKLDWNFQRGRGRRFQLKKTKEGYFMEQDNE